MIYDTIIIGAGSMGMPAGYFLAKQGKNVLLLDSFDPPHTQGTHHGETRIIRHAYGEGEGYVPLALRAQELWSALEQESGKQLFYQTGVINVGKASSPFIQEVIKSANTYSLPLEILEKPEIEAKWPGIAAKEDEIACLEPNSGVLRVEDCITAYRELAVKYGATILPNTKVTNVSILKDEVIISANNHEYKGKSVIVTAGAWASQLLQQAGIDLPLTVLRKTFSWFNCPEELYSMEKFPAFAFETTDGTYYGFPSIEGAGLKVGRHDGGREMDPDGVRPEFGAFPEEAGNVTSFIRSYMPQVNDMKMGKTCMYTMTPDEHFIIDTHPEHPNVVFACGFSGHGFKFSSVVGEQLAELVQEGTSTYDLSLFAADRFTKA